MLTMTNQTQINMQAKAFEGYIYLPEEGKGPRLLMEFAFENGANLYVIDRTVSGYFRVSLSKLSLLEPAVKYINDNL